MACNCSKANKIPACVTNLNIGVAQANTAYFVIFKLATGRREVFQVTADADGNIFIEEPQLRIGFVYEVWISNVSNANIDVRDGFTPNGSADAVTCIELEFTQCADEDNELISIDQTITLQ